MLDLGSTILMHNHRSPIFNKEKAECEDMPVQRGPRPKKYSKEIQDDGVFGMVMSRKGSQNLVVSYE